MAKKQAPRSSATSAVDAMIAADVARPQAIAPQLLERITATANELRVAHAKVDECEQALKDAKANVLRLRANALPGLMQEAGVSMLGFEDGSYVEAGEDVYASISEANAPDALRWLDANNYGAIIKSQFVIELPREQRKLAARIAKILAKNKIEYQDKAGVHPQTLKAFVRESLAEGRKLPPSITVYQQPVVDVKVKKGAKKKGARPAGGDVNPF